jgi:FkbM family methyltransferase
MNPRSDILQSLGRFVSRILGRNSSFVNALRPAYEALLAGIYRQRGIPWSINGVPFRIDPRCRHLMGKNWDADVAAFLRERVKPGALCLNVGANAGVYVLQFCHWSAPDGRVVAFEPNALACQILQRHVRMNGFEDRVEVVAMAISDRIGEAEFHFAGASGMSRLGQPNSMLQTVDEITRVETTTIDAFCEGRGLRPDWLIMDIEGYELHALRGARRILSQENVDVAVEMHPSLWPSADTSPGDWKAFLAERSRRPLPLMGQQDPIAETGMVYLERQ